MHIYEIQKTLIHTELLDNLYAALPPNWTVYQE